MRSKNNIILPLLLLINCTAHRSDQARIHLVWPTPPDAPRIQYLGQFSSPRELGITAPWYRRLHRTITGRKEKKIRLISPYHIFVTPEGDIYVTDTFAPSVHLFKRRGRKYREIASGSGIPMASAIGIAVDDRGRILVADSVRSAVFVLNDKGKHLLTINSQHLGRPTGIAVDSELARIYVVDTLAHQLKVFDFSGKPIRSIGRRGIQPGDFNFPTAVCIDRQHRIYVADTMNFRIQIFDPQGNYLTHFGQAGDGTGYFARIKGIAVDSMGHIYVSDAQFDVVQVFDIEGNFLLTVGKSGRGPGEFRFPAGLYIDKNDIIYVVDKLNQRVQMFQYMKGNDVR